jgi:hypothetical protein
MKGREDREGRAAEIERETHRVGVDAPVAVLARAVDALERLLVDQRLEAELHGGILNDLQCDGVLVGGDVGELEDGAELDLCVRVRACACGGVVGRRGESLGSECE